ncbi:hypothetical protein ACOSQ4_019106 [Xanthoceras sorbifolium]
MVYRTEALIPIESITSTHRKATFDVEQNNNLLTTNLDLVKERMEAACLRIVVYKQRVARYYNRKVKLRNFKKGDLVLKLLLPRACNPQEGTLNFEGPYVVDEDLGNGAYHLVNINGARVSRVWNAKNLRKYYQ